MTIESEIVGKWNFVSSDNFDAYLKEAGVGMMTRTVATKLKPTLEFKIEDGEWSMTSISTFKTHVTKWKLNQSFDDKTADGRDVSEVFTIEQNKLVQNETGKNGGKDSVITRYIEDGKLKIVCDCNGVVATRVYEKAE
ncbi:unnamed protein product [Caenorhabditis auriculariae]|uniref:Cytosolic fatty-acid binding proteins domain-containing protein n=1 Tax=Caenorhabditis auriculariae TaxID=2777116 RepID=A0A8S1HEC7_9PELO|nr:unnamed protein product [Caenorhabditis auriculariae]